ncbi:MAG: hypothetical protein CMB96_04495 [Flavobacteriaceae bacterium]|nr:hypothetical protein [Flavobacteriaceae bacterium]
MMLSTFAKNTAIGFALPTIYDKFFDAYIKNKTLKQQLKLNLFSIQNSLFLGIMSMLYLQNKINQTQFYNAFGYSNGNIILYFLTKLNKKEYDMIFHHIMMQTTIISTQLLGNNYIPKLDWLMARIYLCEFTSVFLYTYMTLYKINYKNKAMLSFLKYGIATSYFFLRIYNFTFVQYYLYTHNIKSCFYLMLPFTGLNYLWFYKILKRSKRKS